MTDSNYPELPESSDNAEKTLWKALGEAEFEQPSARLRQEFYKNLEEASKPGFVARVANFLGLAGNAGWLTAVACVMAGVGLGHVDGLDFTSNNSAEAGRLQTLEQDVAMLHRSLVLDRLQNAQPGKRLRGVIDAAQLAEDEVIASKLLQLATSDRVNTIRSAAVQSLGSQINTPAIGAELMGMLRSAESPFVQLALIDLVLRNGSDEQIDQLLTLATEEQLYPDLQRHVLNTLERI